MKKSMNNKGFSLVELIIVIAIMAVLVGLLAPQYLKYVKNSKVSTDISNAQEMATAINVAFADDVTGFGESDTPASLPDGSDFPESKVDSNYSWSVAMGANGVAKITLNSLEIYPDPKASGHYYDVEHE